MPQAGFDDDSVEHLAHSIGIHILEKSGSLFGSYRDGIRLERVKNSMRNAKASSKALKMADEAWHLLVADGYVYPIQHYDLPRSEPAGYVDYAPSARLKHAVENGIFLERLQTQDDVASILHPDVRNATWSKVRDGHFQDAVMAATHRLEVRLKTVSGVEGTMDVAAGKAFGRGGPIRDILDNEVESESLLYLFKGMTQLIRNPTHHYDNIVTERADCLRMLSFLSYLYHLLDQIDGMRAAPTAAP